MRLSRSFDIDDVIRLLNNCCFSKFVFVKLRSASFTCVNCKFRSFYLIFKKMILLSDTKRKICWNVSQLDWRCRNRFMTSNVFLKFMRINLIIKSMFSIVTKMFVNVLIRIYVVIFYYNFFDCANHVFINRW